MSEVNGLINEACETTGEYECSVCAAEIMINAGDKFPTCDICKTQT